VGLCRIIRESSVAGGVRRIEAVSGLGVLDRLRERESLIARLAEELNSPEVDLERRAKELLAEIRSLQKDVQQERERAARSLASGSLMDRAERCGRARLVLARMSGTYPELRSAADVLRKSSEGIVCVLASTDGDKVALVVGVSEDLLGSGLSAKEIAQQAAVILGGGGGGRGDLAQAGGADPAKLDEAFDKARQMVREKTGG
jgi:alanyl-tRNA synthetase